MARNAGDLKAMGLGYQQRPAEGLIPLQSIRGNALRDNRERAGVGVMPTPNTSQPGPDRAYARNLMRAFFTTQDFGNTGAFSDNPNPWARMRLNAANFGFSNPVGLMGGGRGLMSDSVAAPYGGSMMSGPLASVTTGMDDTDIGVLRGIGALFGLGPFGAALAPSFTGRFLSNTPAVIGPPAPNMQNRAQWSAVTNAGNLSRDLSRTIPGVRSGRALGAQGMRGL